jgi:hypothetical protein
MPLGPAAEQLPEPREACDRCVAVAAYRVKIPAPTLPTASILLCNHHTQEHWHVFIQRGYEVELIR